MSSCDEWLLKPNGDREFANIRISGGGTNFPQLNITVMPKKGRALLWPSTLNAEPMVKDARTSHQAMDVIEGTKFATNGWVHMYDYVTPQKLGCN